MSALLLLKHIYNLSDEAIVARWIENPYWQYFSGTLSFESNPYDGHTLEEHLLQTDYLTDRRPKVGIVDRGYKGKKNINAAEIMLPSAPKRNSTAYQKQKARKRFRARAGIEPVIGHIKHDHRMLRNYLKGAKGNQLNTILAGTGFNLKKMLNRIKEQILFVFFEIINLEKLILLINYSCHKK